MRFEFIAGALCLDFANTIHDSRADDKGEELHEVSDLLEWAREAGVLPSADHDRLAAHYRRRSRESTAALTQAVAIRDLLLAIFTGAANGRSTSTQHLGELNSALAHVPGVLRVRRTPRGLETEWAGSTSGLQQVLFAVLKSAADLLGSNRLGRVRECASGDCSWLFVDESRNRSRRWCDMSACGNRMKARRHYQRARAAP